MTIYTNGDYRVFTVLICNGATRYCVGKVDEKGAILIHSNRAVAIGACDLLALGCSVKGVR